MTVGNTITNINNNTAEVNAARNKSEVGNTELTSNDFLQLFMQQLKQQDPTSPTDPNQLLTQQAQMTEVSQLEKLNTNYSSTSGIMEASSLIGSTVTLTDPNDSNKTISGSVKEATMDSSGANVILSSDTTAYPVSLIKSIQYPSASSSASTSGSSS